MILTKKCKIKKLFYFIKIFTKYFRLCEHYIVFLSNHKIPKQNKHQIYISGEVHGDERVGPTATLELIELMLENKDLPWFDFLLKTRYIVITPMTNPHGYYDKVRVRF